jgi:hypothetical protein
MRAIDSRADPTNIFAACTQLQNTRFIGYSNDLLRRS